MTKAQTIPDTMQAAAIDRFGGIDEIEMQTLPVPDVGPDEVPIRVESVGVGQWDPWEREGIFRELFRKSYGVEPTFPYVIGFDGADTVAAVGAAVTRFEGGDRDPRPHRHARNGHPHSVPGGVLTAWTGEAASETQAESAT